MDTIAQILTALTALIPDPLERWLAAGGNTTVLFFAVLGLSLYLMSRPSTGQHERTGVEK